jgi:hypothetical protein
VAEEPAQQLEEEAQAPSQRNRVGVEIVPQGYLQISFLQPLREHQRSKGISRSKTLIVIV